MCEDHEREHAAPHAHCLRRIIDESSPSPAQLLLYFTMVGIPSLEPVPLSLRTTRPRPDAGARHAALPRTRVRTAVAHLQPRRPPHDPPARTRTGV